MSNYTKTTDFEAKDSLPTGDSGKIIRGAEFETEFDAISTAIATKADTAGPTFTGTLTFETISDGTIGVTAFVDEDDMSSDSATLVPTQQSVKAYVDSQVTAQDLDFQADTGGALSIDLDSETMTFTGGTGIDTSGLGNAVTFAIDSTVATLTGTQTLTNKTLTSPDVNTPDIDGGTIDGTVIGGTTPAAVSATTVSATGNITVGGTVDGRDVATDGTKLDGIESGATADQTAAEIRTLVDSATDSNVFTDADHTKLDGIEASADVTDTANVTAAGALMDSELTSEASVKALNQGVATTDSPTFAGVTVNGTVEFDGLSGTGSVTVTDILDQDDMSGNSATALATQQSIKAYVDSQVATADTLSEVLANGNTTGGTDLSVSSGDDVKFADDSKALFGAGNDLKIYHSANNQSYIHEAGTGDLNILASNFKVQNGAGTENKIVANTDGAVSLYYDNAAKLATTATGIDVTGVITTDGMTTSADINFGDNDKAVFGAGSDLQIFHDGSNSYVKENGTGNLWITSNGTSVGFGNNDLSELYAVFNNDGEAKLFFNGVQKFATSSTGIDVTGTVTADGLTVDDGTNGVIQFGPSTARRIAAGVDYGGVRFYSDSNHTLYTNAIQRLNIDSGGDISFYEDTGTTAKLFWDASTERLGVGTITPNAPVDAQLSGIGGLPVSSGTAQTYGSLRVGATSFNTILDMGTAGATGAWLQASDRTGLGTNYSLLLNPNGGNVGIGSSSPATTLTVEGSGANGIELNRNGADATQSARLFFDSSTSGYAVTNVAGALTFNSGATAGSSSGTERMRIDSSGNVGIGTSSPSFVTGSGLEIQRTTATATLRLEYTGSNGYEISAEQTQVTYNSASSLPHVFEIGSAEKMRLDAGNLLVGTTSDLTDANISAGVTGIALRANKQLAVSRTGNTVAQFNRNTSDGDIVAFRKDGTTVGSIQTKSSDLAIGTGDTGVRFVDGDDALMPHSVTANDYRDAAINFGTSNYRFKDLYLSGNINLSASSQINSSTAFYLDSDIIHFRRNNESESARIDSSGNLLVGKTSLDVGTVGQELRASGYMAATRDGSTVGSYTRLNSDGIILEFRKDSAAVGSIGSLSGTQIVIDSGGNRSGVRFEDNGLLPRKNSAMADGTVTLGNSSYRFSDLYLSGTVNVGGSTVIDNNRRILAADGAANVPYITFSSDTNTGLYRPSADVLGISTGGSERVRIDSSGNLLVGTTSTTADEGGLALIPQASDVSHMYIGHATGTATGNPYMYFRLGSSNIGSITQSGTTAVLYNTSSDQRLKDNIVDAPSASDDIDAIQVRSFDWKADGSHQKYGMVAQELQSVAPEAVTGDANSDDMMGVDYSKLVPMLVKEIQSLRARVAQLEGAN